MSEHKIKLLSVKELKKRRDTDPSLCLIDVRDLHEWNELHIPGALHLPKDELSKKIANTIPNRAQPIYLHCHSGMRSRYAAHALLDMGYTEVYSIDGGIADWIMQGYPIEN